MPLSRRSLALGAASLVTTSALVPPVLAAAPLYRGPNVIVVRFGGGVRRRETIEAEHSYAPTLVHDLIPRGTLFRNMVISDAEGVETSHAQGTLYIITGRYDAYADVGGALLGERFEPKVPSLFEYLRKAYRLAPHEALIVNAEDRSSEDFLSFSSHHHYGVNYRSSVLSLYRFKLFKLKEQLRQGGHTSEEETVLREALAELEERNYRGEGAIMETPETFAFWQDWRARYGDSGLRNGRGDRLLTELALGALRTLKPKLLMVNYQDPDYVHWGNASHYTRAISIIDDGLKQLVAAVETDEHYRDNTVFVIVPDCGRDDNRLMSLPFQHHFNSKAAHEIWALILGKGIAQGVVDRPVDQIGLARTVAAIMGFDAEMAEAPALAEVFG